MKILVTKQIGKSNFQFEVEKGDAKEGLAAAAFFATTPDRCTVCKKEFVTLDSNKTEQGHTYVKIRCLNPDCRAASTLGSYKDGSGHFWKPFEIYNPNGGNSAPTGDAPSNAGGDTGDLPF